MPEFIGKGGENFVARKLGVLDGSKYMILRDIMLPSGGNTAYTQIDIVVVSYYGIFCIEVKAYKGWIFGNSRDEKWTQVIYKHKGRFYNPLRQNYAHTQSVGNIIGINNLKSPIISLVVFSSAAKIKVSGTDAVGDADYLISKILSFTEVLYSDDEVDLIYSTLEKANISSKEALKQHKEDIRTINGSEPHLDPFLHL